MGPTKRRDRDSNPGYPLGVYTLSRRASSATRASLLIKRKMTWLHFSDCKFSTFLLKKRELI